MKNIFDKESQSIADAFHTVHDLQSFLTALISSAPTVKDADAKTYLTLANSALQQGDFNSPNNQTNALNIIAKGANGSRLGWLAEFELVSDFETLQNTVVKTSTLVSDSRANTYMDDLKSRMEKMLFDMNPNTDKIDREPASTIFATLHETARKSVDLRILAASEVGKRASGGAQKIWADELHRLNEEKAVHMQTLSQP